MVAFHYPVGLDCFVNYIHFSEEDDEIFCRLCEASS